MINSLNHIDQQLFLKLNGEVSPFIDQLMYLISDKYVWVPFYLLLVVLIVRKYRWNSVWFILGAIIMITLTDQISNVLKDGVKRFRPCKDPEIGHLVHIVNNYCRSSYGFVSAHAANSFALAVFISLIFRYRSVFAGMVVWAAIVSYSRIYLGVHYPGDVICGGLIGALIAWIVCLLANRFMYRKAGNIHPVFREQS